MAAAAVGEMVRIVQKDGELATRDLNDCLLAKFRRLRSLDLDVVGESVVFL